MRTALAGSRRVLVIMAQAPLLLSPPHIASQALPLCIASQWVHSGSQEAGSLSGKGGRAVGGESPPELMGGVPTAPANISLVRSLNANSPRGRHASLALPWHSPGTLQPPLKSPPRPPQNSICLLGTQPAQVHIYFLLLSSSGGDLILHKCCQGSEAKS